MAEANTRVAVLMGGTSTEREVSLSSGTFVARSLRQRGYAVAEIRLPEDLVCALKGERPAYTIDDGSDGVRSISRRPPGLDELRRIDRSVEGPARVHGLLEACSQADIVFIALHGGSGEDGSLQAILETAHIPHTGASSDACAVAFNKAVAKPLLRAAGIVTADWQVLGPGDGIPDRTCEPSGFPAVVKPAKGGSTLGVQVARSQAELDLAVRATRQYSQEILVEDYVDGIELTAGVIGREPLPIVEIVYDGLIFDYAAKYQPGGAQEICPARISPALQRQVQESALRAHAALKLGERAYSRIDFKLSSDGVLYCLEANVLPGLTPFSLLKIAADAARLDFAELCRRVVEMARHA
jgi:D-alanine-D-alanine ligase